MFVDATAGRVLGVPGLAQEVDPDTRGRHQRGVEIDEGVARRGAEDRLILPAALRREFVAKLAIAEMQVAIAPVVSSSVQSAGIKRSMSSAVPVFGAPRIPRLRATIRPPRTIASLISTELVVARETASILTARLIQGPNAVRSFLGREPRTTAR